VFVHGGTANLKEICPILMSPEARITGFSGGRGFCRAVVQNMQQLELMARQGLALQFVCDAISATAEGRRHEIFVALHLGA
jgi:hypothetical protein